MESGSYVIHGGAQGRERLRVLAGVVQASTRDLLTRAGVTAGAACLDVGCGGGDTTFELARLVGRGGRVVGIDMDEAKIELARRELAERRFTGVELRVGKVGDDIGVATFDVAYARFVLTHLVDPAGALVWMLDHLRPGGVVVVEDIDFRGHFCHPPNAVFDRYVALYSAVVRRRGADPDIGARLPGLLLEAGCEDVGVQVVQPAGLEGDVKRIAAITMENITDAIQAADLASDEEIEAVVRDLHRLADDRSTVMSLPRIVQVWGRRAARRP